WSAVRRVSPSRPPSSRWYHPATCGGRPVHAGEVDPPPRERTMPDRTFNDDDIQPGNLQAVIARAASLAERLQNIADHLGKCSTIVPGPPNDQALIGSLNALVGSSAAVGRTAQSWLQRQPQ